MGLPDRAKRDWIVQEGCWLQCGKGALLTVTMYNFVTFVTLSYHADIAFLFSLFHFSKRSQAPVWEAQSRVESRGCLQTRPFLASNFTELVRFGQTEPLR